MLEHYGATINEFRVSQMISCVLHQDSHPSCSVNTERNVWKCHSCGEGGDAYALIQKKEGTDFDGARRTAASLGLTEGDAGGSDGELRVNRYGGSRTVSARQGNKRSGSRYVPSWRRG